MVLSLYGIADIYIRMTSAIYENNTAVVKVGNENSSWFPIESELWMVVLYPFIWIILMDFF